jgi:hypothetical protein
MKSVDEFLLQSERRAASRPTPSPNRPCSATVPVEVIGAAALFHWRLFPVLPRGMFAAQKALMHAATSDEEQLEKWSAAYPGCDFALATGASGVFSMEVRGALGRNALRVLSDDDWDWWHHALLMSAGEEVAHAIFHCPAELSLRKAFKVIAPGLRLRSADDFLLIPPAVVSGVSHRWLNPEVAVVGAAPQFLLEKMLFLSKSQASRTKQPDSEAA